MLGQRVITAIVLLAILAGAMYSSNNGWFLALLALAAACAVWEWLRLTLPKTLSAIVPVATAGLLLLAMLYLAWLWLSGAALGLQLKYWLLRILVPAVAVVWVFGATLAVVQGRSAAAPGSWIWSLFALPAVLATWSVLALTYMTQGAWFVVSLLALVWIADIAAYFAGRAFGKRKLAPKVSPGKTMAGAVAGVLGAVLWVALSSLWADSFGAVMIQRWGWGLALPLAALLGMLSIVGDLFESLLKRRAGRKDSSALLPGHGGVYDRIDAILPVAPLALLLSGVLF